MKVLISLFITLLSCNISYSAELFASVDALHGSATVSDDGGESIDVTLGQKIYAGQSINTASDSEVHLVTQDGGLVALRPNTEFRVDQYKADGGSADKILMTLLKGTMRSITGWIGKHNPSAYSLKTFNNVTIGIRGTDHETTVILEEGGDQPGTYDTVIEGATVLKNANGSMDITPGKFAFASKGATEAPHLLASAPKYWTTRSLKIEDRVQKRKEKLRSQLEQMRKDRISQTRSGDATSAEHTHEHHETVHNKERKL